MNYNISAYSIISQNAASISNSVGVVFLGTMFITPSYFDKAVAAIHFIIAFVAAVSLDWLAREFYSLGQKSI